MEVLSSRIVSDPLTLFVCFSIGDGGAALLICSEEYAAKHDIHGGQLAADSAVALVTILGFVAVRLAEGSFTICEVLQLDSGSASSITSFVFTPCA